MSRSAAFTGFTGFEWFCIHAASIWTWTGSAAEDNTTEVELCHSEPSRPPQGVVGVSGFSALALPGQEGQMLARAFTGPPVNDSDPLHRTADAHPKPPLSHLLWFQLQGPVGSKAILQLRRLLIRSNRTSLSTLVLGQMIDPFSSPCDTYSRY